MIKLDIMMDQLSLFIQDYHSFIYLIVFVAIIIEGDISLLLFGALSKERILNFSYILPVVIVAAIAHDLIFWKIGTRLSRMNKKKYLFFNFEKMSRFLDKIKPSIGVYVLLSKFAWNFNRVVIVSSGYIGTPIKKFLKYSCLSAFLWSITYMSLGYVFADQTDIFKQKAEVAGILIAAVIIVIAIFEIYIKKTLKKYFFENNENYGSATEKSDSTQV
jgi:membrane protein DedA with SNARE-associated domain